MNFDWSAYKGNLTWLPSSTIYLTVHGSHAYGTNTPESDLDVRGVCIAPKEYHLGFKNVFEQAEQHEPDLTVFELRKFLRLAAECNPNVIEVLFTDDSDRLQVTPAGEILLANRDIFLSRKAKHTFSGYAISQLRRINLHYRWLKNPPKSAPTRAEFNLPERTLIPADQLAAAQSSISKRMDEWTWHELEHVEPATRQALKNLFFDRLVEVTMWSPDNLDAKVWESATRSLGYSTNFIELLDLERRYTAKHREWEQYQGWLKSRNPARAAIEAKYGYDCKHAYHLIRLLRMCREILTEGKVLVRRPDREELLAIRNGAWSYERLVEWAEAQDKELTELAKTSPLPNRPNDKKLDLLCINLIESSFRSNS